MKLSPTMLKSLLMLNAALLGALLLKLLFVTPVQAQEARSTRSPGNYQVTMSGAAVIVIDTRDGALKVINNGKVLNAHWETNYKEFFQAGK
jgi:hypothetical protein